MWGTILGSVLGGAFQAWGANKAMNAQIDAAELARQYRMQGGRMAAQAQERAARKAMHALVRASRQAGRIDARAANQQLDSAQGVIDDQLGVFQPAMDSGENALAALNYEMGIGDRPAGYTGFTGTPGYDFRFNEGARALEGASAAAGMSLSGEAAKELARYGQDYATGEYQNYLAGLGGLMSAGQGAAGQAATAMGNYGALANAALGARGTARSNAALGIGAARGNALSAIGDAWAGAHYFGADAGGNAAEQTGNAQAAGYVGIGNAMNDTIGNIMGGFAYGQPSPSPAYGGTSYQWPTMW